LLVYYKGKKIKKITNKLKKMLYILYKSCTSPDDK